MSHFVLLDIEENFEDDEPPPTDSVAEREIYAAEKQLTRQIRHVENELPKLHVLVESVTGESAIFDLFYHFRSLSKSNRSFLFSFRCQPAGIRYEYCRGTTRSYGTVLDEVPRGDHRTKCQREQRRYRFVPGR